jgi:hypothetical protein
VGDRRRYWSGFIWTYLGLCCVWLFWALLDPVGLDSGTRRETQEITAKVMSNFYGYGSSAFGQSKIAVVLITDKTVADGQTYPLPYSVHELFFERILQQHPAAVFVDLNFARERAGDSFAYLTRPFEQRPEIPVFFAAGRLGTPMPPVLEKYRGTAAWEAPDDEYPLWQVDAQGRRYPTAAMALYQRVCANGIECRDRGTDGDFQDNLVVQWGAHIAPQQADVWHVSDCTLFGDGFLARLGAAANMLWRSFFDGVNEWLEPRQACFYPLTIRAEQLADLDDPSLLAGRVVFYGADVSAIPDQHLSPVHGLVPGVFVHAMALDNLLTYGRNYFRDPGIKARLLEAGFWMLMIVVPSHRRARAAPQAVGRSAAAAGIAGLWHRVDRHPQAAMLSLALLGIVLNEFVFHWEVKNWLGLMVLYVLMRGVQEQREAATRGRAAPMDRWVAALKRRSVP